MKTLLFTLLNIYLCSITFAQSDNIIGVWFTQDYGAKVEIYKTNNLYYGKIIWLKNPVNSKTGKPLLDDKNPDASKRKLPLIGSKILWNFKYLNNEYIDGNVYDSRNGKIYSGKLWLEDNNTLKMRGYWGMLYNTETWKKIN
jgi:uncharacterized protein (DUF2147 family)